MEFRSKIQTTSHKTATFQGSETELVSEYKHAGIITDAFFSFSLYIQATGGETSPAVLWGKKETCGFHFNVSFRLR